jgi:hypothetical protein
MLLGPVVAAQPPAPAGIVKHVAGAAAAIRSGQEFPLTPGQPVLEGDVVRTGADGRLGITLKDGTRLSLGATSEVRIDRFAYAPGEGRLALALKVARGVAEYISGRIARLSPGAVKIETPTSIIGIRGTRVLIEVERP